MSEVASVDLNTRTAVTTDGQRYQGDFLVLAAGSQPNFFGTPGADEHSYPMYSVHDAETLRSRILAVLEAADRDPSVVAKGALNFVIVGAGPTGVEMAGAFGDTAEALKHKTLTTYHDLPADQIRVFLVDHGHAVLGAFSDKAQSYAAKMLQQRGIELRLATSVKEVGSGHVTALGRDQDFDPHRHLGRRTEGLGAVSQSGPATRTWWPRRCATRPLGEGRRGGLRSGRFREYRRQGREAAAATGVGRGTVRQVVCAQHRIGHRRPAEEAFRGTSTRASWR